MKKFLLILASVCIFTSCVNETPDIPPMLTLYITDPNGRPYVGAVVDLYNTSDAYEQAEFPILTGVADSRGVVTFTNLHDIVYWFDIYDTRYPFDNYDGINYTKYPLQWNTKMEIDVILYPYNPSAAPSKSSKARINRHQTLAE